MKKNKNIFIILGVFLVILCNSIVYGALNTDMFIDGDAYVRVDRNIRVTGIKVIEQTNGAYETYNCDYSKDTTSIQATLPSSDSFIVYEVTITNKGDIDYEVSNIVEESYSNSNIKYEIIDLEKGTVVDGETTHTFKIKLTTTENDSENKETLVLKYAFEEWVPSLYNMVAHKSRSLDTDIDFGVAPTKETSGVYEMASTKDDEYPVYYYRGIVENNNVSFAGFCWKAVRTTSTGGVKLIYNGVPSDDGSCDNTGDASRIGTSAFNTNYTSKDDVSYMYDNGNDSTIKKVIDKWYSDNMVEYTEMLEDIVWCNDRSIVETSSCIPSGCIRHFFGPSKRNVGASNLSINCSDEGDKFTVSSINGNGRLTYPAALLTADEVTLAGSGYSGYSDYSYLVNGNTWRTISPYSFYSTEFYASVFSVSSPSLKIIRADNENDVRPSISLVSATMIKGGNGSVTNPYKLIEEKTQREWVFDYTGEEQEFKVPYDGEYKIELWGASGSDTTEYGDYAGGKGAYTSGNIELEKDTNLYLYIGEEGKDWSISRTFGEYSFNGASGGSYACYNFNGGKSAFNFYGGSATDIRLIGGSWNNSTSLNSRIMVAAGGGSAGNGSIGGSGGGLTGYGTTSATGANQTEGGGPSKGVLGKAGLPVKDLTCNGNDRYGAGSGYYGGGVSNVKGCSPTSGYGGGSGSSFISGHTGCVAITSEQDQTPKSGCTTGTSDANCSIHYSGKVFTNTKMIDGAGYNWTNIKGEYTEMPSHDGESTIVGNTGNGYAKITLISKK